MSGLLLQKYLREVKEARKMLEGTSVMGRRVMKGGAILPCAVVEKAMSGRKTMPADHGISLRLYGPIGLRAV
jgi:hypothetical protein